MNPKNAVSHGQQGPSQDRLQPREAGRSFPNRRRWTPKCRLLPAQFDLPITVGHCPPPPPLSVRSSNGVRTSNSVGGGGRPLPLAVRCPLCPGALLRRHWVRLPTVHSNEHAVFEQQFTFGVTEVSEPLTIAVFDDPQSRLITSEPKFLGLTRIRPSCLGSNEWYDCDRPRPPFLCSASPCPLPPFLCRSTCLRPSLCTSHLYLGPGLPSQTRRRHL